MAFQCFEGFQSWDSYDPHSEDSEELERDLDLLYPYYVTFEGGGAGRPKKPMLTYDGLEIDIPFANSDETGGEAAP